MTVAGKLTLERSLIVIAANPPVGHGQGRSGTSASRPRFDSRAHVILTSAQIGHFSARDRHANVVLSTNVIFPLSVVAVMSSLQPSENVEFDSCGGEYRSGSPVSSTDKLKDRLEIFAI